MIVCCWSCSRVIVLLSGRPPKDVAPGTKDEKLAACSCGAVYRVATEKVK